MKDYQKHLGIVLGAIATPVITAAPLKAQVLGIENVQINTMGSDQVELQLTAADDFPGRPQIFTVNRGNKIISDVLNVTLDASQGNFSQSNPAPGIAAIEVIPVDNNTIRIVIEGKDRVPTNFAVNTENNLLKITFNSPSVANTPATGTQGRPAANPEPEVLFPNPNISIEGRPSPLTNTIQPVAPAPPFLPRAVAPPVGDIAISNIDSSPEYLDLGSAERIPRLVLRDAPVREVLNLLGRSADLNVIYTGAGTDKVISLDLENEPVQDVFNYVLTLSELQANRRGRTIFVGEQLPQGARNLITRSYRLNQVPTLDAETFFLKLTEEEGSLLEGLKVYPDERLNSLTLVGEPRQIEIANNLITQIDARKRQAAINVKIVDVNLTNTESINTSFSYGIADNLFLAVNDGASDLIYGGFSPAPAAASNFVSAPVVVNPLRELSEQESIFLEDPISPVLEGPYLGTGIDEITNFTRLDGSIDPPKIVNGPDLFDFRRIAPITSDPRSIGVVDIQEGTEKIINIKEVIDETTGLPIFESEVIEGEKGNISYNLPQFFQYPNKFLARVQNEISQGNAKILSDPTLIVQDGEIARIGLTQEVFGGIKIVRNVIEGVSVDSREPIIKNAGLELELDIERIDDNGFITMTVNPIVSSITGQAATPDGTITLLAERTLESGRVRLRDNQTLILAGIIQDSDRVSVSKVPILGDLPILGSLFRSTSKDNSRSEVIVMVTPQILDDSDQSGFGYNYVPSNETREFLQEKDYQIRGTNF